jgi:hypothetical protein
LGVIFRLDLPTNWIAKVEARQILLTKSQDSRICKITADPDYDLSGLKKKAAGKELEFEKAMKSDILRSAVPWGVQIDVDGKVLSKSDKNGKYRYAVMLDTTMTRNTRSNKQRSLAVVTASRKIMARLECANMHGSSDDNDDMAKMIASFDLR